MASYVHAESGRRVTAPPASLLDREFRRDPLWIDEDAPEKSEAKEELRADSSEFGDIRRDELIAIARDYGIEGAEKMVTNAEIVDAIRKAQGG